MAVASTENLRIILTAVDNATRVLKGVNKSIANTQKTLDKATAGAKKFTKVVGLMAGVAGGLAVKEFASFEKQMSKVKAITNANSEEFKKMTDLAKKMGATTAFTGKEAGDALEFLGMAGLSVQEAMDALPGALELASAGNLSLGESADIATNIMAQFGIEAKNIGRVNDVLAKSATSANTSVQEMAEAMKYMGPVANALKVPLEETASAINILANNGIKGGMAGQSFSASLLRITKLTPNMKKSVDAMNLSLFDQNGKYIGLTETIKQLEEGTKNMTDEEKAKHIATLFGIQSTKQWLTLLKEGSGEMEKYTESLENAEGSAKKMAETQLDNLAGSFTLLESAISGAMIEIGGAINVHLRPALDWLTDKITNWRGEWEALSPVTKSIIKSLVLVAGGMIAIALVIGAVSLVLIPIIATFGFLTTVVGGLATVLSFVGGAFVAVGLPIILLIASIIALGVVIYKFYKNWDDIMLTISYLTGIMKDKVSKAWEDVKWAITDIVSRISTWLSEKWTSIKNTISSILGFIGSIFKRQFDFYKSIIVGAFNIIKAIFTGDLEFLKNVLSNALNFIKNIWSGAMGTLKSIGIGAWKAIKSSIGAVVDGLVSKFTGFQTKISGIYDKVSGWLKGIFGMETQAKTSSNKISTYKTNAVYDFGQKQYSSNLPPREIGGAVSRNKSYLVGERGPELFTPGTSGRISPNSGDGGNGGGPVNLYFGDVVLNNGDDEATFFQKIENVMIEVQRKSENGYA